MYELELSNLADKKFNKISKKNKVLFDAISNKIDEIKENPEHFKPLSNDMKGQRRIHFGHFVLTFEINYEKHIVKILDFDHHDKIYK